MISKVSRESLSWEIREGLKTTNLTQEMTKKASLAMEIILRKKMDISLASRIVPRVLMIRSKVKSQISISMKFLMDQIRNLNIIMIAAC